VNALRLLNKIRFADQRWSRLLLSQPHSTAPFTTRFMSLWRLTPSHNWLPRLASWRTPWPRTFPWSGWVLY